MRQLARLWRPLAVRQGDVGHHARFDRRSRQAIQRFEIVGIERRPFDLSACCPQIAERLFAALDDPDNVVVRSWAQSLLTKRGHHHRGLAAQHLTFGDHLLGDGVRGLVEKP
ncbi:MULTISPECIES: hypothetical protein [Brevundimonas]|uniref:hypothetical protein n=1 Tax=Brevundimonas TaxID=41275 RepID=UPI0025BDBB4F|nr:MULTISPECIES: hypothetical protein [Brevundimonas]